jgi:hypothetical protein
LRPALRKLALSAHLVRFIRACEAELPKQHPVGITALWVEDPGKGNQTLRASPADWIAPQVTAGGVVLNLAATDGSKVSLIDSDHWFVKLKGLFAGSV